MAIARGGHYGALAHKRRKLMPSLGVFGRAAGLAVIRPLVLFGWNQLKLSFQVRICQSNFKLDSMQNKVARPVSCQQALSARWRDALRC